MKPPDLGDLAPPAGQIFTHPVKYFNNKMYLHRKLYRNHDF